MSPLDKVLKPMFRQNPQAVVAKYCCGDIFVSWWREPFCGLFLPPLLDCYTCKVPINKKLSGYMVLEPAKASDHLAGTEPTSYNHNSKKGPKERVNKKL
jgi:hypothetical protein